MKKIFVQSLALCLALALCLCLTGCKETEEVSTSVPEESSELVSSEPESEPEESSHFVPAPDLISTPGDIEEGSFEDLFSQNPIDKKYDKDYSLAMSFSTLRQACDTAARNWRNMVDAAYQAALEVTEEKEQGALMQAQTEWEMALDGEIDRIREEADDSNDGIIAAAKEVVLLYRERAKELCKIKFDIDGTLPAFIDPEQDAAAVG